MQKNFGHVGVFMGGSSTERSISLQSGTRILQSLKQQKINATPFDPAVHSMSDLVSHHFDHAFIALHGTYGEDGCIQGVLELMKTPYTGSGVAACALAMDKISSKQIWSALGLTTPAFIILEASANDATVANAAKTLGFPFYLKAPLQGSSIGVFRIENPKDLTVAWSDLHQFGTRILAEKAIAGREMTVAILGNTVKARALPIVEIIAPGGQYNYINKYESDKTKYIASPVISDSLSNEISDLALSAYKAVGCSGWARVDILLDKQIPTLLEINTTPGMTSHSLVPMAAAAAGISFDALCLELLQGASLKQSVNDK